MERKRINAQQREAFVALYAGAQLLSQYEDDFVSVAKRVKHGHRDIKMIMAVLEKLLVNMLETIPLEQLQAIKRQMSMSEIRVAAKNYTANRSDDWVMSREDINSLVVAASAACLTCDNTDGKGCELSRLIDELPVEVVNTLYVGCK